VTIRLFRTAALTTAAILAVSLLLSTPAWAHVTVHPATLPAGSSDIELAFRVPNERDDANTVTLQVFFPSNLPLLTVDVRPVPGWTSRVDTKHLATPVKTDDGSVTEVVTDVTWTATAGGIAPGQYQDFDVAAGQVPVTPGPVVFKSLQTYSSGEIVRWIEVASSQDPDPDSPAPVLTLTPPPTGAATPTAASSTSSSGEALAGTALAVSIVALAGVTVLLVSGRRRSTRGIPPPDGPPQP
jgi:uncharacterized protein YcnI